MSVDFSTRWVRALVDTRVISANVARIAERVAPARVWAVVKANGYGHGAIETAQAALRAGATGLCVAIVDEGVVLRRAGIGAPILVLSEQPPELADFIVGYQLTPTITTTRGAVAIATAAANAGRPVNVHIKVDSGMHRVGVSPREAVSLAKYVASFDSLVIEGLFTHLAVADEPDHPANQQQIAVFDEVLANLAAHGMEPPLIHIANSAAALTNPSARRSMVRVGIAMYGLVPGPGVATAIEGLDPALSLVARVSAVRWVEAGEAVSYGLRRPVRAQTLIATVPLGYADGVRRGLSFAGVPVLIGGVPRTIAGTITMDQMMVDCGTDSSVSVGDEVVLIGRQGDHVVTADQWAEALGTIGYEVVCGIGARVHRVYP